MSATSKVPANAATPLLDDLLNDVLRDTEQTGPEDVNAKSNDTGSSSIGSIVIILLLGVFVANADGSLLLATYGIISTEFDSLSDSGWIFTSFMISASATQGLYGKLSEIYGRKSTLLVAYTLFTAGLAICGAATSLWHLVLGRVVSGCGGAGMTVLVSIIITDLVPISEVAIWRSYVNIAATIGRSLGGPIGGFLGDTIGWRWSFLAQCPLAILAIVLVSWRFRPPPLNSAQQTAREKFARIDFLGAASMTSAIVLLLLIVDLGGKSIPWNSISMLFLGLATLGIGALFVKIEYVVKEPIFPPHLFTHRAVVTSYAINFLLMGAQLGMMFAVPVYFQVTANSSATSAGAHLVPAVFGNACGGVLAGVLINRTGRYKNLTIFATIISSLSYTLLLLRWRGQTNFWESLYILPGGFGTGIALSSTFITLSAGVEKEDIAIAGSGLYLSGGLGAIGGLSLVSTVLERTLYSVLHNRLSDFPSSERIIEKAVSNLQYVTKLKQPLRDIIVGGYVQSLEYTHFISLAFSCLALVAALFIKEAKFE